MIVSPLLIVGMYAALMHAESGAVLATTVDSPELVGEWTYRSFRDDPDLETEPNDLLFGAGTLTIESISDGHFRGRLDFGPDHQLALKGWITFGNPPTVRFQGVGDKPGSSDWVYDYQGYQVLEWPNGENQRLVMVGSIVRTEPHSGGQAPAGVVASWIAVKREATEPKAENERD